MTLKYGKHVGAPFEKVAAEDRQYCAWVLREGRESDQLSRRLLLLGSQAVAPLLDESHDLIEMALVVFVKAVFDDLRGLLLPHAQARCAGLLLSPAAQARR